MLYIPCNARIELICRASCTTFVDMFDEYLWISKVTQAKKLWQRYKGCSSV